jgi:NADPH:quinone reductase-like Zn-dependent oxidoreductase
LTAVIQELLEAGKVVPVVEKYCHLSEVPETIRYLVEERAQGKVVITVELKDSKCLS